MSFLSCKHLNVFRTLPLLENKDGFLVKCKKGNYTRRQDVPDVWEYNGAIYLINTKSLLKKEIYNFSNVKYYIFNLEPVVKVFKEIKLQFNFNDLYIIDNIEEIFNKNFDFVNFGSCVQYFANYENILDKISDNSKFIFFSGTTLYSSSDDNLKKNIIVKQMNMLPKIYYLQFFNKKKFYEIFTKKGFNLVFEEKNLTDNINYDNFKKYLNNVEYTDFLFTKN